MADQLPTPARPGLWVRAAVDPARPFGPLAEVPRARFACSCGFVRDAAGEAEVLEVVTGHHKHRAFCPLEPGNAPPPSAPPGDAAPSGAGGSAGLF
jgi:hypothetical protein